LAGKKNLGGGVGPGGGRRGRAEGAHPAKTGGFFRVQADYSFSTLLRWRQIDGGSGRRSGESPNGSRTRGLKRQGVPADSGLERKRDLRLSEVATPSARMPNRAAGRRARLVDGVGSPAAG
jgi:hypothetical protein